MRQHHQHGDQRAPEQHHRVCVSTRRMLVSPAVMASVWRSRIIGIETTLTAKISPAKSAPTPSQATMKPQVVGVQQRQQRALEVGHAVEADGKDHQRGAAPQHLQHQQHEAEDRQRAGARVPGQQRIAEVGLLAPFEPLAGAVQAQAQERAHQQEAGRQRQHVGRRGFVHLHQRPAHDHEAGAVEQADAGAAQEVAPAQRQPAQRVGQAQAAAARWVLDAGCAADAGRLGRLAGAAVWVVTRGA